MGQKSRVAIAGLAELKPVRRAAIEDVLPMLLRSAAEALLDAGIETRAVDGLLVSHLGDGVHGAATVADALGLHLALSDVVERGDATGAGMVVRATAAIAEGRCQTVLCAIARPDSGATTAPPGDDANGATPEQRARIAVAARYNACHNPDALCFGEPITLDEVLASPVLAGGLHELEIAPQSAGAAAIVITTARRAQKLGRAHALVLGCGERTTTTAESAQSIAAATDAAFAAARLRKRDISVAIISDPSTAVVLRALEASGLAGAGRQAGAFVEQHLLQFDGSFPLNTHGGQLAFGGGGGLSGIIEAVRQITRRAPGRQVPEARTAFVHASAGAMNDNVALVLGRG
jgi:acetyl-CoA acetyltransferase